ncbi:MAG: hypothetical protein AB7Q81_00680 [Gammaproteobacteria bacterium]
MAEQNVTPPGFWRRVEAAMESPAAFYVTFALMVAACVAIVVWWFFLKS